MSTKSIEKGFTWGGLALATVAAFGIALVSASAGIADEAVERSTKIKLMVDRDGTPERVTLIDLHEMAVGESRTLATESGRPVTVTRDDAGFEVDIDGKKVRVQDRMSAEALEGLPGEPVRFEKRIVIGEGGEEGEPRTLVFHGGDEPGNVVVMKRIGPDGHEFAWSSNGAELPVPPFGVEGTISRLEQNAKFQELDPATRATVLEALRESAPKPRLLEKMALPGGEPGKRMVVIEVDHEESE